MSTNDNVEAFLQVMAGMQTLTASDAAKHIAGELVDLRKRDQDHCTMVNRLIDDKHRDMQRFKDVSSENHALHNETEALRAELSQVKEDLANANKDAEQQERALTDKSGKLQQLERHMVSLTAESEKDAYDLPLSIVSPSLPIALLLTSFFPHQCD